MKRSSSRLFADCLTALDHFAEISERSFRRVLEATKLHDLTSARRKVRDRWSSVSGATILFFVLPPVVMIGHIAAGSNGTQVGTAMSVSADIEYMTGPAPYTKYTKNASMSVGFNKTAGTMTWTYTGKEGGGWIYKVAQNGYSYNQGGVSVIDVSPAGTGTQTLTGTVGYVPGQWYTIGARVTGFDTQAQVSHTHDVNGNFQAPNADGTGGTQPEEGKKLRWGPLENPGANPLNYQVWKVANNLPVADLLLSPGQKNAYIELTGLPASAQYSDYVLKWWLPGLIYGAGGQWVTSTAPTANTSGAPTGGETVTPVNIVGDPNYVVPESQPFTPTNTIPVPTPTNLPTGTAATGGGSVWKMGSGTAAALDTEGYREGIDKLIADRASARVVEGAFNTHYGADGLARAKGYGGTETGEGTGTGAKTGIEAAYAIPGAAITGATAPGSGSFSPFALVTSKFGTIDFNPQNHPEVVTLMAWIKAFFAWVLTVVYSYWVFKHFRELTSVGAVSQIRGHSLALGAGGQVSALGNAVVWTTIMLSLPVVFTAALTSAGLEFPSLTGLLTSPVAQIASLGPGGAAAAALISAMLPWEVLILVLVGPIIIQAFSIPIYMGVQSAIRWLIA